MDAVEAVAEVLRATFAKGADKLGDALAEKAVAKLFDYIQARYGVSPQVMCAQGGDPARMIEKLCDMLRALDARADATMHTLARAALAGQASPVVGNGINGNVNSNGTIFVTHGPVYVGHPPEDRAAEAAAAKAEPAPERAEPTPDPRVAGDRLEALTALAKTDVFKKFKSANTLSFMEWFLGGAVLVGLSYGAYRLFEAEWILKYVTTFAIGAWIYSLGDMRKKAFAAVVLAKEDSPAYAVELFGEGDVKRFKTNADIFIQIRESMVCGVQVKGGKLEKLLRID